MSIAPSVLATVRADIDRILHDFLSSAHFHEPALTHLTAQLHDFVMQGGKRLRPLMCCLGHTAVTGRQAPPEILRAAASLELFHAFALIHDDIIDESETRRGSPTLHRNFSPTTARWDAERADHIGVSKAILAGDVAFAWSDQILHTSGLSPAALHAARPVLDTMRTEVMGGQYLDVDAANHTDIDVSTALTIIRYKTAKYTIERPLHLGAILAGANSQQIHELTRYAVPLGEAFQLRDDLLGVFGDPAVTGKSRLDDLREGKRTVLVALALRDADPAGRRQLDALLGKPDLSDGEADRIRGVLTDSGARRTVENMIAQRREQVLAVLDHCTLLHDTAVAALRSFADSATRRAS